VAGLELNISCPNISHGLDFGTDPHRAAELVAAVRRQTELCLIVKLTPNVTDITEVGLAVQDAGADCVSAVNTYLGMKVSLARRGPVLPGAGTAGLSGPAIKPLALAAVARLRQALQIPVVGIGGIACAQDALEFMVAGADAVQIGTANFYQPGIAAEVARECLEFASSQGISNWNELRWAGGGAGAGGHT
jgi:dihydroorotate dehydrogenase (NAD+) catalytic subunit